MQNRSIFHLAGKIEREFDEPLRDVVAGFIPLGLTRVEVAETLEVSVGSLRTFCEKSDIHFPRNQSGLAERVSGTRNGRARPIRIGRETTCIAELAREHGINPKTIYTRMRRGWPLARAIA